MGVEIRGNDGGITTIATDDSNTGSALQIDTVIGGVSGTAFAINSPAGQVRVNAIKSGAYPAGLALVNPTTTVNDLTNSLVLYVVAGFTGANEAYFEDFTPTGTHASVMLADGLISGDVAAGWLIDRELRVSFFSITDGTNTISIQPSSLPVDMILTLQSLAGIVPVAGDAVSPGSHGMASVELTAQSAAISATNLTNTVHAGYYVVFYTIECTTTQVGAATVQFGIAYTDDIGATTQAGTAITLTVTGRDRGSFQVYLASGDVTYNVAVTGVIGLGRFAVRARIVALG